MRLTFTNLSLVSIAVFSIVLFATPTAYLGTSTDTTIGNLNSTCVTSGLCPDVKTTSSKEASQQQLAKLVGNIIQTMLGLTGVIFIILVIVAGDLWMTAGGNAEKVSKAQHIMISAVIGLVAILAAYVVTNFVIDTVVGWVTQT